MNPYAYISLFTFVIYLIIAVVAWTRNPKGDINRIFAFFCVLAAYVAFAEFGYRQAANSETAYLWIKAIAFRTLAFAALVHVVLVFTEQKKLLKNPFTYVLMYAPALTIALLWLFTPLFVSGAVKEYWGWTYARQPGLVRDIAQFWSFSLTIMSLYLCWRYYAGAEGIRRKQARLVSVGLTVAAPISVGVDALLPLLNISFPELTVASVAVGGLFIIYSIWKYELFSLTPATASEEIIATMSDFMFLANPEGKITSVNEAATAALGCKPSEIVGEAITSVLFTERSGESLKLPTAPGIKDIEMTLKTKKGQRIPVSVSASLVTDARKVFRGYVYIARDITERKLTQENLQELYDREKTLRQDLENEIKKRADFTRALVHELMTPLTAIIASSELLADKSKDETWSELTDNVRWSSLILQKRINDLLDLSKGEMGMLQLNPAMINPVELFDQIAKSMAPVISSHKQSLIIELPTALPEVYADEDRLLQILFNLIDNA